MIRLASHTARVWQIKSLLPILSILVLLLGAAFWGSAPEGTATVSPAEFRDLDNHLNSWTDQRDWTEFDVIHQDLARFLNGEELDSRPQQPREVKHQLDQHDSQPALWQTWWFRTLLVLLLVGLATGGYRLRSRRSAARTRELEMLVAARTAEIEQRQQIAEGLREILVILNSQRSLEESLHHIVSQAAKLTDAEDAIVFRLQGDEPMKIVATNPGGQIRYSPGVALLALTQEWISQDLLEKQPLILPDMSLYWTAHPEVEPTALGAHQALLGIPLFLGDEIYGGLLMFYTRQRSFSGEDLELGSTFADQAALAIANDRLRHQVERSAVAAERSRLARDLHDAVTQTLFSASLIAETLPHVWEDDPDEGRELLEQLRQLTRGALAEMRTLLLELRPAALEEAQLPDLLRQLAEAVTGRSGLPVTASVSDPGSLPTEVRVAIYRIAQESLNNVVKHARASQVVLRLAAGREGDGITLQVKDDGRGFDPDHVYGDHLGLDIIRERAQAIGATLEIKSYPGEGTDVIVVWEKDGWHRTVEERPWTIEE